MHLLSVVGHSDEALVVRVRSWRPPRWFCLWMRAATRLGDGWGWLIAAGLLLAGGPSGRPVLFAVVLAALATNALQVPLKRCVHRRRPCEEKPHPLFDVRPPDRFSFPSGHAMNAFALAGLLTLQYPFLGPVLGLVAASIAVSRVVMGLHYMSDVVAGALLGLALGTLSYLAVLG
jgi:undecaprenyl-diphosphatase